MLWILLLLVILRLLLLLFFLLQSGWPSLPGSQPQKTQPSAGLNHHLPMTEREKNIENVFYIKFFIINESKSGS